MLYPRVSLYAMMLAAAGIPLYIHLPRFASVDLGIGLGTIGTLLLVIRVVDFAQDPLLGWVIDRWPRAQLGFALMAAGGLAVGFPVLFNLSAGAGGLPVLVGILVLLFSAYSLGSILLYGRSATLAAAPTPSELLRLAAFREGGMLAGVILAAMAPAILVGLGAGGQGYAAYGLALGVLAVVAAVLSWPIWTRPVVPAQRPSLPALGQSGAVRLLLLALVNSLPVAITSTLFLFFVEDRMMLSGLAGPLLVLFFLSAGLSVPVWTRLARTFGGKQVLMVAMPLAILGFIGAALLSPGNAVGFALICIASGAALGADMVVLPALFSVALTQAGLQASLAFGIWSFAGKFGLALAAFLVLPLLEMRGFVPGAENSTSALSTLTLAYAILPCLLKLLAFGLVLTLPSKEHSV
ncbi:Na+/melibiose symporter [Aliiroseovarius halocynthiae]|uniref:Sodium:galactoside symporter n=1 Tax=Aliiroseovarius halocynthiae TaxID=985055 RepID=A0A545SWA2_9RHOB|nr:MFS transporter [Aliiroseovarius halocynthiae]TQV69242.1 sodium:galactoside symporter [Aliiroseovarius halocynthiae]SMR72010.1 Na+/melibiose symporter [Aliiroseovarius halocynthiae]